MQYIFIHLLNDYSGSPKVLSQVVTSVKESGNDVILFTGKSGNESTGFLSNIVKKHQYYFYKRFHNRYATLVSFMLSQLILFFKLLKYVNKDVVIYVNTMLPFGAALAGFMMRKPVYYHVHEISMTPLSLKRFLRSIIQLTATKVIYVSEAVKMSEPFKQKESLVIYNGVSKDFALKGMAHKYNNLAKERFQVLMIGSLKDYKGIKELFAIAAILENEKRIQFTVVLNAEPQEIAAYVKTVKLPLNVKLVPRQKNVIPFYQQANLVLNLSRVDEWVETFGLTIIEAMSFGIPVIVPPVGGPTEIVANNKEGYLIASYNIIEIADKIRMLSNNESKCMALSKSARERALFFNEANFNKTILNILNA